VVFSSEEVDDAEASRMILRRSAGGEPLAPLELGRAFALERDRWDEASKAGTAWAHSQICTSGRIRFQ
jgi:hypothetical protein